jgi:hypothetical protein
VTHDSIVTDRLTVTSEEEFRNQLCYAVYSVDEVSVCYTHRLKIQQSVLHHFFILEKLVVL